ncbi:chromate transporter [Tranquillimonas rosea]|uniref:Chromate transporter n=1 Tax=Tranquillimonas rosea TaxID=641238 RepID=A0A1H9PS59_9RHOB|nr:chromate efflux transporter [Tranquillimonas rosea]SER51022.1 chromate transporter [Tranquillimonas rosea]
MADQTERRQTSLAEITRIFGRIGLLSFGGPAAQIALMHRELVELRPWLDERSYLRALSFCMMLPGPEAMQLATYCGWRLRGVPGGLIAGGLFVLPGALVILALAAAYAAWGSVPLVQALFLGVQATVVVIVIEALLKVARRALTRADHWVLAALSFLGIFVFQLPFPLIVGLAALWGLVAGGHGETEPAPPPRTAHTLRTVVLGLAAWGAPILALWAMNQTLLVQVALFFSKLAVVTFGGAYAVLAYMTQEVVAEYGWISTQEMIDGLGLAETTPGPLILVTLFVGFLAGANAAGPGLALAAGAITLWVTFVPCFIWIFAGAPWIDGLTARPRLRAALAAITAAVVGVILNLSLWFAAHVFFRDVGEVTAGPLQLIAPDPASLRWEALALAVVAGILLLWRRWSLPAVLGLSAALGILFAPGGLTG